MTPERIAREIRLQYTQPNGKPNDTKVIDDFVRHTRTAIGDGAEFVVLPVPLTIALVSLWSRILEKIILQETCDAD